jgi:membrane protease YdiL (CAAX protease family)
VNPKLRRWLSLGRVLLFYIATVVIVATAAPLAPRESWLQHLLFISATASVATLAVTLLFLRWEGLRLDDVGIRFSRHSAMYLVIGFLIGLALVAMHTGLARVAGHIRWVPASSISFLDATLAITGFLLLSAREELAFHGYALRRISTISGVWVALFVTTLVFALEHRAGGSPWGQAVFGAAFGCLLFGMATIASRGLALPLGLHAAMNFGDWVRGGKPSSGFWTPVVETGFEEQTLFRGMVNYVLVFALATLAFWAWHRFNQGKPSRVKAFL